MIPLSVCYEISSRVFVCAEEGGDSVAQNGVLRREHTGVNAVRNYDGSNEWGQGDREGRALRVVWPNLRLQGGKYLLPA